MEIESLAEALEREHREIDAGIEQFVTAHPPQEPDRRAVVHAIHGLRRHIYLEEEFLFPALTEAGLVAPVFVMLREHAEIWATLEALEREVAAGVPTSEATALCLQLTGQLQDHNVKEERVLYPQADHVLAPAATEQLRAFLDAGALPEGWVCRRARV